MLRLPEAMRARAQHSRTFASPSGGLAGKGFPRDKAVAYGRESRLDKAETLTARQSGSIGS